MQNEFEIREMDSETFEIWLNGEYIMIVNHDEHGWQGIELVCELVKRIADKLDIPVRGA